MDISSSIQSTSLELDSRNTEQYPARSAEVGNLLIHRALPNRGRKMVGAWCFLDHAGPVTLSAERGMHVGPHPHIGLQTLTWMIEGSVLHRDSLGNEQLIQPGEVNLMTAGRGITHTEDTVPSDSVFHAVQLWIALPTAERHRAPSFRNYSCLPVHHENGFDVTVLTGSAFGLVSPADVHTPLVGLDFASAGEARLSLSINTAFEYAILVLGGNLSVDGEPLTPDVLSYISPGRKHLELRADSATRFVVLGGTPFEEDIVMWWNFVARAPAEIVEAVTAWNEHRIFEDVQGASSTRLTAPELPPAWKGL
ncbi:pirin family protein [Burkholderia cepacia]|uniref:pirin family protein n=1 Tax=Burkholderia cepacia TaxID=292 RepID=UPI002AB6C1D8|nr:pirin family protein [Burkholderia cepacia]